MNRLKHAISLFAIYALCALSLTGAFATEITDITNSTSDVTVEFEKGTGPTYPVDPDTLEPGAGDGVDSSFAIVSISDFDFGPLKVTATEQTVETNTDRPNIQVVDLRGTGVGWSLTASTTGFTDEYGASLPGAEIRILNGGTESLSLSNAPTPLTAVIHDGNPVPVVEADDGAGMGQWVVRWYGMGGSPKYVELYIPAGVATVGSHSAIIDWVLEDTPT